ncbi:MAG: hypothetical protein DMG12_24695 [Acidobacteria bacterium]|nr:MAG: hypothetical protein DMG12_24695 [Acidobacteriota bacterium]
MKKKVWIGIGLVAAAIGWYAFRPELLFVNKSVSESFPAATVAANTPDSVVRPRQLATGQFMIWMARVLRYGRENISLE